MSKQLLKCGDKRLAEIDIYAVDEEQKAPAIGAKGHQLSKVGVCVFDPRNILRVMEFYTDKSVLKVTFTDGASVLTKMTMEDFKELVW